jgi:hypothetical protein
MDMIARFKLWQRARKERRVDRLTEQAGDLDENRQHDLLFLHERGFVQAEGRGQSITCVHAEVENLIRKTLRVVVTPGTYFISRGGHQNMATTSEYAFTLHLCGTEHISIAAACINADRPIPGEKDQFRGVARVSDDVVRFLVASRAEDAMVIQAGVWTLTDSYTRDAVIHHLVARDRHGNTTHPITDRHCDRAKAILDRLGVVHRL